jgi:hypothetical protein
MTSILNRATLPDVLTIGGVPRVHLLPKEVEVQRKAKALRRYLLMGLAGVVALVAVGYGVASLSVASAVAGQATEQARSLQLITEQGKYNAVTTVQNQVDDIKGLQPVIVNGEILWADYIGQLQGTLPAGVSLSNIKARLDTTAGGDSTVPLQGEHVATISATANGSQALLSQWLTQVITLKGVVNATPGTIAVTGTPGVYSVNVTIGVNSDVIATRFAEKK